MSEHKILSSSNNLIDVENLFGQLLPGSTMHGIPLGTADGTATGELVVKVAVVAGGSTPVSIQRTPAMVLATTSGTVAAGAKVVEFIFSSSFTGTVLGVAFAGATDSSEKFTAPGNDTLGAIVYTVTAGSVRIMTII